MAIKFISRWLFGREIGALLHVSEHAARTLEGRDTAGMRLKGVTQPGGFELRANAVKGDWKVVNKRQGIDHLDVYIAEKGLDEFITSLDDQNLLQAAKLLGLFDFTKLRAEVERKLKYAPTHVGDGPQTEAMAELDLWVRAEITRLHPELAGNGAEDEA